MSVKIYAGCSARLQCGEIVRDIKPYHVQPYIWTGTRESDDHLLTWTADGLYNKDILTGHYLDIVEVLDGATASNVAKTLNDYASESHNDNMQWWLDRNGNKMQRNKGELLCLIHSEISEAMEGERKNLMDDHLPHRRMAEVELADALIRIFDYAGAHGYDLEGAYQDKRAYNKQRADHKREARDAANGKKW